jgi:uncharacterized iron-regulated membrane protein
LKLRLWHRSTGVIVSALLAMMAITGLLLVWPLMVPDAAAPARTDPAPSLDAAFNSASAALPGQNLRDIRLAPSGHAIFHFAAKSANHWDLDTVVLTPAPRITYAAQAPALWMQVLPLHTGDALGTIGQWGIASVGCALLFLTISGVIAWNRARKGKKS